MKKILFLLAMLPIRLFTACSSDDDSDNADMLSFLEVKVSCSDPDVELEGKAYLFKDKGWFNVTGIYPGTYNVPPFLTYIGIGGKETIVYPVSDLEGKNLIQNDGGYIHSFLYWNEFSDDNTGGMPEPGDYIIMIKITETKDGKESYLYSTYKFEIYKNSIVDVIVPYILPASIPERVNVDGNWSISNYK